MISIIIPPTLGMAIGTMISDPRPVDVSTGMSARIVVAVVIRHGRTRRAPAAIVASRAGQAEDAMHYLEWAVRVDPALAERAKTDTDLTPLATRDDWARLIGEHPR